MSNTPHKHKDLIIAWAEGAEIEVFNKAQARWELIKNPSWFENYEYRVKPTSVEYTLRFRKYLYRWDGRVTLGMVVEGDVAPSAATVEAWACFVAWIDKDWQEAHFQGVDETFVEVCDAD